jgi:hypothetical protein
MEKYEVVARWVHGLWELEVLGVGLTQSTTVGKAEETVRDYLDCLGIAEAHAVSISFEWQAAPVIDSRPSDELIGYDENGVPS